MEFKNTKFYHKFLEPGKSEFIVRDSCALINKSNGTNCKQVCKLYGGASVSELLKNPREPKRNS